VQAVRDDKHRPGIEYVVEGCRLASVEEPHLVWWFD
jgi:hypothetical protein